jgi:uncharacterized protein (TIGR03067 family)
MICTACATSMLSLALAVQPPPPRPGAYSTQETTRAIAPGPAQPGPAAFQAADLIARNALIGTWQATDLEINGQSRPEIAAGLQMRFSRGRLELLQSSRPPIVVAYNVNPTKSPTGFTWRLPDGGVTFQDGIYSQEGETLVICLSAINAPGATQFLTQPNDGRLLFVLQRISP